MIFADFAYTAVKISVAVGTARYRGFDAVAIDTAHRYARIAVNAI
jgi:hypothetical protein